MEPGYGSPIGAHDTVVVVDDLVARSPNLVAGANREGFHYRNVNVGRDFTRRRRRRPDQRPGGRSAARPAAQPVILRNGIEVGNIFKLGTKYTDARRRDLPRRGRRSPTRSSWARTGSASGANVACIVEAHHDDKGIVWPAEVAPYAAHLVSIGAAQGPARRRGRRAAPRPSRSTPVARSCGTTATSRRASSSPTPSCSGCPGS